MFKAFFIGIARASGNWKMILLLLSASILFSLPLAIPIFIFVAWTSGGTLSADRMFADKIDIIWLIDVFNQGIPGFSLDSLGLQLAAMLIVAALIYIILNTLFSGGMMRVLASDDGRFTMRKFWAGCGAYFGRFFRLLLISLLFYGAAIVVYTIIVSLINKADARATALTANVYKRWAAWVLLLLMIGFVNMVFDYAKVSAVINDSRKMFRETINALRFAFRHFFKAFFLYLLLAVIGLAIFLLLSWCRYSITQSSGAAIMTAFLLGQIAIASRWWSRLSQYASELELYEMLRPVAVTEQDSPDPVEAEIESLPANMIVQEGVQNTQH